MVDYSKFVETLTPEQMSLLSHLLTQKAQDYSAQGTQIAHESGKDWRWRAASRRSMAQAMYTLVERLSEDWSKCHGN